MMVLHMHFKAKWIISYACNYTIATVNVLTCIYILIDKHLANLQKYQSTNKEKCQKLIL